MLIRLIILLFTTFTITSYAATEPKKEIKEKTDTQDSPSLGDESLVQPLKTHSIGIGIGQTFLLGDFDDNGEDAITVDIFYSYAASYSFDFFVNAHYSHHDFMDKEVDLPGIAFGIKGKFFQFDQFTPFAIAGLGFYKPKATRNNAGQLQETDSKFTFGTSFGVGVELKLNNKFAFGILAQYHNPFDVKQEVGLPLEGSYSKLMITSMYTF